MRRLARWIALETAVWALVGLAVLVPVGLLASWRAGAVAAACAAAVLAAASWCLRSRWAWARRRGLGAADRMSGEDYEDWLATLFAARGWRVRRTPRSGDFGADLLLSRRGETACVQAKRRGRPVGVGAVQEVATARLHYGADRALVVTTTGFTRAARELAASAGVELWDREAVARELLGASWPRRAEGPRTPRTAGGPGRTEGYGG